MNKEVIVYFVALVASIIYLFYSRFIWDFILVSF